MITKSLGFAYRELVGNRTRQVPFWILIGFLPTFLAARLLVAEWPGLFLDVRGVHVHHFTYGVIVLAAVGFISLVSPKRAQQWLAVIYGIGLALAFDEFGMWLRLTNNYNLDQSEDVMVGILCFLVAAVYLTAIVRGMLVYVKRRAGRA
jgi:hypothetical protein